FPAELEVERLFDYKNNPHRYAHIWEGEYEPQAIGAIWDRATINRNRRDTAPAMGRILVSVDPPISSNPRSDYAGIIVGGLGNDAHGYVLADHSCQGPPKEWAERAIDAYDLYEADAIVAETNQGGEMVANTIHSIRPGLKVIEVKATRGKHIRAEPISALYGLDRIHHVGAFPELEQQMCLEKGTLIETNRGQIPVELVTTDDLVMTRNGLAPLRWAGQTGSSSHFIEFRTANSTLRVTECHPIFIPETNEFVNAENVSHSHRLLESHKWANMDSRLHGGVDGMAGWLAAITATVKPGFCIVRFTKLTLGLSNATRKFIIKMKTQLTTALTILFHSHALNIMPNTGVSVSMYSTTLCPKEYASSAEQKHKPSDCNPIVIAQMRAPKLHVVAARPVYNLSVSEGFLPEYFANGILTHNCLMTADGYQGEGSPDRVDAMVHMFAQLFPKMTRREKPLNQSLPTRTNSKYRAHRLYG
ncbi:MAG: Hint domain-containing protein, partial [Armatimonadota bacterium]|nr:Hint domain-containing protein [Armatimonadota bacterium]